ncbi:MAG: ABC transporter ATP-binding protein [Bacteroidales bacterium]
MIQLEDVKCGYGKKAVLSAVTVSIEKGKLTCMLGRNGAGKTTLFKTILGIIPALGGSICYSGKPIGAFDAREFARYIGYVPQAHNTPFPYNVLDVVLMGRYAHSGTLTGRPDAKSIEIAISCIRTLDIEHLKRKPFSKISGGEKQMVMIARTMAQQPRFIAMDEPTSSLDVGNQVRVMQQARMLAHKGIGVIMNTHSPQQALQYADRVILLNNNRMEKCGKPSEVLHADTISELYSTPVEVMEMNTSGGERRRVMITL